MEGSSKPKDPEGGMKEYVELEHAVDWLSEHSDEQQSEGFPKIYDRYEEEIWKTIKF